MITTFSDGMFVACLTRYAKYNFQIFDRFAVSCFVVKNSRGFRKFSSYCFLSLRANLNVDRFHQVLFISCVNGLNFVLMKVCLHIVGS